MHSCIPINILMQRVFTIEHHVHHWFLTSSIIATTNLTDTSLCNNNIASFPLFPLAYFQTCLHKLRHLNQGSFHPRGFSLHSQLAIQWICIQSITSFLAIASNDKLQVIQNMETIVLLLSFSQGNRSNLTLFHMHFS
jgi:hypothetical protein